MPALRLIVGLGNPGAEYADTRHNVGFWLVERLADELKVALAAQSKFFGRVARAGHGGDELWLLCPSTYMNRSGQSVAALARFYKIAPAEILVVHDELDLPPGAIRLKQGGGNAGHNGLKDITAQLGTPDFWRLRLGIGHPRDARGGHPGEGNVADYVLHAPRKEEQAEIDRALDRCLLAWPRLSAGDFAGAQQQLHGKAV